MGTLAWNGQTGNGTILVYNSGFVFPRRVYVADGGFWNPVKALWVNKSGTWTQSYPQPYQSLTYRAGYPNLYYPNPQVSGQPLSGSFRIPQGYTKTDIIMWGGGGGGGASGARGTNSAGGGGGAGSVWFATNISVNPGDTFNYQVATYALGGTQGSGNAGASGASSILYDSAMNIIVECYGGQGGAGYSQAKPANPGGSGGGGARNGGDTAGGTAGAGGYSAIGGTFYRNDGYGASGNYAGQGGGAASAGGPANFGGNNFAGGVPLIITNGVNDYTVGPTMIKTFTYSASNNQNINAIGAGGAGAHYISNVYGSPGFYSGGGAASTSVAGGLTLSGITGVTGNYSISQIGANGPGSAYAGSGGSGGGSEGQTMSVPYAPYTVTSSVGYASAGARPGMMLFFYN